MVFKQGEIEETNLVDGLDQRVIVPRVEIVELPAKVGKRPERPVVIVDYLHLLKRKDSK